MLTNIRNEGQVLLKNIELLWTAPRTMEKPKSQNTMTTTIASNTTDFHFSPMFHHKDIILQYDNSLANNTTSMQAVALVEPKLPMDRPSRLCFRVNRVSNGWC